MDDLFIALGLLVVIGLALVVGEVVQRAYLSLTKRHVPTRQITYMDHELARELAMKSSERWHVSRPYRLDSGLMLRPGHAYDEYWRDVESAGWRPVSLEQSHEL